MNPPDFSFNFYAAIIISTGKQAEREALEREAPKSMMIRQLVSQTVKELISHCEASEPFCSPLSKINGESSARWGTKANRLDRRGQNFRIALASNEILRGRTLLALPLGLRARISPFSQITEQMLTQFRRRIGRYSVFRKC